MAPRPARFTRTDAVEAAFEIVDRAGADQLTMRRVSTALGVDPMALYRHFTGKAELTEAVAQRFWAHLEIPSVDPSRDWRDYATSLMLRIRESLAAHPNVISLVATHPITSPSALAVADRAIGALLEAGAPLEPALGDLVNTLVMLTVASALGEFAPPGGSPDGAAPDASDSGAARGPASGAASELSALPHLGRLFAAGWEPSQQRQLLTALHAVLSAWRWQTD